MDGFVFEHDVAFAVSFELPWFYEDDVVFAYPEFSFESTGDAADASFAIEAAYGAARCAVALYENAEEFVVTWSAHARKIFRCLLLRRELLSFHTIIEASIPLYNFASDDEKGDWQEHKD